MYFHHIKSGKWECARLIKRRREKKEFIRHIAKISPANENPSEVHFTSLFIVCFYTRQTLSSIASTIFLPFCLPSTYIPHFLDDIIDVYGRTWGEGGGRGEARGSIERERRYKKKREKNTEAIEMGGGAVVERPRLICKWKGTEIEFYVRIELAIFFSQIAARREEVAVADEREISHWAKRRDTFTWRRLYSKRWMFPNNSQGRSLTCHETFNSSFPSRPLAPLTANFVPPNSRCLDPTSPIALPRNLAEKSSGLGQEIIRLGLRNRLS